ERPADAVAHEVSDHRQLTALSELLDGGTNVADARPWPDFGDAEFKCPPRDLRHFDGFLGRLADIESGRGITVEPVENMGNIDIDDVAVAQYLPCAGDAVADDLIDRGAHTLGEPLVV